MTARLSIPAEERGVVRVFAVNLPEMQVATMLREAEAPATEIGELPEVPAAADLLGWPDLDTRHTELFAVKDLTGLGLSGYLTEGLGLEEDQIAPDHARLSALDGYVLLVLSRAFRGQDVTVHVPEALTLIGSYKEKFAPVTFEPLPGATGQATLTGPAPAQPPDQARRILRVAALTALILMLLAIGMVAILGGYVE